MLMYLTIVCSCLVVLVRSECTPEKPCDKKVIKCIKDVNNGSYPVKFWSGLQILWNKEYSIVWYSKPKVKGFDCIRTAFTFSGAKDTYTNKCQTVEEIPFKTTMANKEFIISDYKGINMKAYVIYFKNHCFALYVCSPYGVQSPHVTIYCLTSKLGDAALTAEKEEAKDLLTKCDINDGVDTCVDKCT